MPKKVHLVKAMVFPVVMYGCESWTIKKAECRRIDAFELWCWRRLLRVPWTVRRSNQSILKEISPEYSLEGLMLKLKFQYFGHLMRRTDALEKPVMLGKIEGRRRRGQQSMRQLDVIMASPTLVMDRESWHAAVRGVAKVRTRLRGWTELNWLKHQNCVTILKSSVWLQWYVCRYNEYKAIYSIQRNSNIFNYLNHINCLDEEKNFKHCQLFSSVQSIGRVWLFATPDCSMPGLPVHHQLPKLAQTHVHRVSNAIQTSPSSIIPPTLITYYICCLFIMF